MDSQGIFGETFSILEKGMDLRSIKHDLIVSNVANMDTPGYKAFDLVVEEEMAKTRRSGKGIALERSKSGHMTGIRHASRPDVEYKAVPSPQFTLKGDRNSVDIDKAMADLAENTLMYKALAQILSMRFHALKNVIQEGRR